MTMNTKRNVIVYIAMSADGYIAKPNDDLSFLSVVEKSGEDYGYGAFTESIDTVIVGRKTYDWVVKHADFPHTDKNTYVITKNARVNHEKIIFYTGDLTLLIHQLKSQHGKNIFCDGGAQLVNELMKLDLVDEFIISVVPIFVGNGTKLFEDGRQEQLLELVGVQTFDTGLVQMHYKRKRD
jgi:dihydrofolate reductase